MKIFLPLFLLLVSHAMAEEQHVSTLTTKDQEQLNKQRAVIEKYLGDEKSQKNYQTPAGKLGLLRALLAQKVFRPDQKYELQSMGVVLGDAFVQDMKFKWVIVKDEYGQDPAIQSPDEKFILYPLTMISKRLEQGLEVDVFDMYNGVASKMQEIAEGDKPKRP